MEDSLDEWPWDGEEEKSLDEAITRAMNSTVPDEIATHLKHFLGLCREFAKHESSALQCLVYNQVAYAYAHAHINRCSSFAIPPEQSIVWRQAILEWVEEEAAIVTDIDRRCVLCLAILEPMTVDPIYDYDMDWLMSLLRDKHTIWAVVWAFDSEEFPANFVTQYERYANRQLESGLEPVCYPDAKNPEWIMSHRDD